MRDSFSPFLDLARLVYNLLEALGIPYSPPKLTYM